MFIVVGLYYCTTLAGWWFNTRGPHTYAQRWDLFKMHGTIFNKFYLNTKIHMRLVDIIIGQGPYISRIACDNHWLTWHSTAAISTSLLHPLFRCPIGPAKLLQYYGGKCYNNDFRLPNFDSFISLLLFEQQTQPILESRSIQHDFSYTELYFCQHLTNLPKTYCQFWQSKLVKFDRGPKQINLLATET